jgi:hypothetical protein
MASAKWHMQPTSVQVCKVAHAAMQRAKWNMQPCCMQVPHAAKLRAKCHMQRYIMGSSVEERQHGFHQ